MENLCLVIWDMQLSILELVFYAWLQLISRRFSHQLKTKLQLLSADQITATAMLTNVQTIINNFPLWKLA